MSIQLAAKHLAAHGRGPDTTLVHMTPGEVASLQALAQQHGGSLSINPQTGLPEAGFLSALLPMAAGAGLAAMGMPAGYAALSVGAASAATNGGDMKKAILNGFSAYTGAGLADSFMGAGAAMQSGTATSWMGGEAPAAASTISTPTMGANGIRASDVVYGSSPEVYRGPSYAAEAGNVSLTNAAPAEVAQAAAQATPAAQQAAALQSMDMGQRFDALKAGASGTNAMNYIKANPFASLGTATAMLTPDENKTPQKAADTDRGPRAGLSYYPGWSSPLPKPNMQGVEQTYNRPYYAAKGGVTRMASGGITSAPRNQQQLFADYLQRVSSSGVAATPPTNKYDWWKNPNDPAPAAPAPAETAEEYAARMRVNARGGGGGRTAPDEGVTFKEPTSEQAYNWSQAGKNIGTFSPLIGGVVGAYGNYLARRVDPNYGHEARHSLATPVGTEPAGGPIDYGPESGYMTNTDPYFSTQLGPGVGTPAYVAPYTSEQFSAAPSTGYTSSQFSDKSFAPNAKRDPSAGLSMIEKYSDPSKQPEGFFPPGTAYTDTTFFRDSSGNLVSIGEPIGGWANPVRNADGSPAFASTAVPRGTTAGRNVAISAQNAIAGSDMQRALDSQATTYSVTGEKLTPVFNDAGKIVGYKDLPSAEAQVGTTPLSTSKIVASAKLAGDKPITDSVQTYSPFDAVGQYGVGEGNYTKNQMAALITQQESTARDYINAGQTLGFEHPKTIELKESYDRFNNLINAGYDRVLGEQPAGGPIGIGYPDYKVAPDIVGVNEISADPNADKTTESLGIPDAATFASMLGAPLGQYVALNNGVISDAGVSGDPALAGYQGGYNPGYATPNMGYYGGSSGSRLAGITGSFGGLGSAWQGVVDRNGNPVLTSQGAAERAFLSDPGNIAEGNQQSWQGGYVSPVTDPAQKQGQGRDGGDGGDSGGDAAGNAAAQTRANDNSATSGGWFGGGSNDARGGYLQNGKFDQRMANGGLSAMANPYNLGSYSDGGRLLKGPGDGVSDSIPATIGKGRPARLADGEFVIPARIVSEIGNGSTDAGARKLYAMMDRIQAGRKKSVGKGKVAVNSRAYKHLPA